MHQPNKTHRRQFCKPSISLHTLQIFQTRLVAKLLFTDKLYVMVGVVIVPQHAIVNKKGDIASLLPPVVVRVVADPVCEVAEIVVACRTVPGPGSTTAQTAIAEAHNPYVSNLVQKCLILNINLAVRHQQIYMSEGRCCATTAALHCVSNIPFERNAPNQSRRRTYHQPCLRLHTSNTLSRMSAHRRISFN